MRQKALKPGRTTLINRGKLFRRTEPAHIMWLPWTSRRWVFSPMSGLVHFGFAAHWSYDHGVARGHILRLARSAIPAIECAIFGRAWAALGAHSCGRTRRLAIDCKRVWLTGARCNLKIDSHLGLWPLRPRATTLRSTVGIRRRRVSWLGRWRAGCLPVLKERNHTRFTGLNLFSDGFLGTTAKTRMAF